MINRTKPSAEDAVRASAAPSESGIAARIAQLDDLRDSVAERPMSGMLLRMTAPDGSEDLIRVSVRGHSVDATVDVRDSTTASLLSRQVNELSQALERHGLDAERLVIRTVRSNDPGLTAGTSAAPPDRDSLRMTGSARSGDGDSPTDRHGTRQQQQSHDPSRQRTRRGFRGTP